MSTKNHPGGVGDVESFEKVKRFYQATDDPSDGFNALGVKKVQSERLLERINL